MQKAIDEMIKEKENSIQQIHNELSHLKNEKGYPIIQANFQLKKEAILHIGILRFDYKINTSTSFDEFDSLVLSKITKGTRKYGFDFNNKYIVHLKNNDDLKLMYRWYSSDLFKSNFIHIVPIKKQNAFQNINLDYKTENENTVPFLLIPTNEVNLCIFCAISNESSLEEGLQLIHSIDSNTNSVSFLDTDNDSILIKEDAEWEYFLSESFIKFQAGQYNILKANSQ